MIELSRRAFFLQSSGLALAAGAADRPELIQEYSRGGMMYRWLGHSDLFVSMLSFGSHTNPAFKRRAKHGGDLNEEGQALRDRQVSLSVRELVHFLFYRLVVLPWGAVGVFLISSSHVS